MSDESTVEMAVPSFSAVLVSPSTRHDDFAEAKRIDVERKILRDVARECDRRALRLVADQACYDGGLLPRCARGRNDERIAPIIAGERNGTKPFDSNASRTERRTALRTGYATSDRDGLLRCGESRKRNQRAHDGNN